MPKDVRWVDPVTGRRMSVSESVQSGGEAESWISRMRDTAGAGLDPGLMVKTLSEYGEIVMPLAIRDLEAKTLDPHMAGWHKCVVPALGHLTVPMITYGAVDRAVHGWIADGCSRSTIKNSLAILVRVMEQAVRDGIIEHNRARVTGLAAAVPDRRRRTR
jgi:hypothetical protein